MELSATSILDDIKLENFRNVEKDITSIANNDYLVKGMEEIIESGVSGIIKILPVHNHIKNNIMDIICAVKKDGWRGLIVESLSLALKEGFEIVGVSKEFVNKIAKIKESLLKGGFKEAFANSIDAAMLLATKSRILPQEVGNVITLIKDFIFSDKFENKLNDLLSKFESKNLNLSNNISLWNEAYNNENLLEMDKLAKEITELSKDTLETKEITNQVRTIQNINNLAQSKKNVLDNYEMELCNKI